VPRRFLEGSWKAPGRLSEGSRWARGRSPVCSGLPPPSPLFICVLSAQEGGREVRHVVKDKRREQQHVASLQLHRRRPVAAAAQRRAGGELRPARGGACWKRHDAPRKVTQWGGHRGRCGEVWGDMGRYGEVWGDESSSRASESAGAGTGRAVARLLIKGEARRGKLLHTHDGGGARARAALATPRLKDWSLTAFKVQGWLCSTGVSVFRCFDGEPVIAEVSRKVLRLMATTPWSIRRRGEESARAHKSAPVQLAKRVVRRVIVVEGGHAAAAEPDVLGVYLTRVTSRDSPRFPRFAEIRREYSQTSLRVHLTWPTQLHHIVMPPAPLAASRVARAVSPPAWPAEPPTRRTSASTSSRVRTCWAVRLLFDAEK